MNNHGNNYSWVGWVTAAVIAIIFVAYALNSSSEGSNNTNSSEVTPTISTPSVEIVTESEPSQDITSWSCVDATSYNQNAYDDNKCTKGTEVQYVSDSQAFELDPSYSPGKAGATYYNNQ